MAKAIWSSRLWLGKPYYCFAHGCYLGIEQVLEAVTVRLVQNLAITNNEIIKAE
jgi:hypothetical protein